MISNSKTEIGILNTDLDSRLKLEFKQDLVGYKFRTLGFKFGSQN